MRVTRISVRSTCRLAKRYGRRPNREQSSAQRSMRPNCQRWHEIGGGSEDRLENPCEEVNAVCVVSATMNVSTATLVATYTSSSIIPMPARGQVKADRTHNAGAIHARNVRRKANTS